jgi:hypothetical protein
VTIETVEPFADVVNDGVHTLMSITHAAFSRWPVVRVGPRGHIPYETQRLVFARDNYRCRLCDWDEGLAIDHVVPWSAGGSDTSRNLRVLCAYCNNERSNRKEVYYPRLVPCASRCTPCLVAEYPAYEPWDERIPAFCGRCGWTSWVDHDGWLC